MCVCVCADVAPHQHTSIPPPSLFVCADVRFKSMTSSGPPGHGYPDIITDHNGTFITETYKSTPQAEAKTHLLPQEMLDLLFQQRTISTVATASLAASFTGGAASIAIPAGTFPNFAGVYLHARYGFTLDFWLRGSGVDAGNADNLDVAGSDAVVLFSSKAAGKSRAGTAAGGVADAATEEAGAAPGGAEVTVSMASNGTVSIVLKDGEDDGADDATWWTDPTCSARLRGASGTSGGARHLGIVVDAGPKMIMFTVDGHLCDGGAHVSGYTPAAAASSALPDGLAAGWHLFSPELGAVGGATASVGSTVIKGKSEIKKKGKTFPPRICPSVTSRCSSLSHNRWHPSQLLR